MPIHTIPRLLKLTNLQIYMMSGSEGISELSLSVNDCVETHLSALGILSHLLSLTSTSYSHTLLDVMNKSQTGMSHDDVAVVGGLVLKKEREKEVT